MRKFFIILLLFTGWAVIFSPWFSGKPDSSRAFYTPVHPSNQPMPQAWQDAPIIPVSALAGDAPLDASASPGGNCAVSYTIQAGDTLGEIARGCGVTLGELLSANRKIDNPDRIYPGQQIAIPNPRAGRGGGNTFAESADSKPSGGLRPGASVKIDASGLPPNTTARIGLGLSNTGYIVIGKRQTDASGHLSFNLSLPVDAQPGETAFIMVTTLGTPSVQQISKPFVIEGR